jgi:magnesium chelatase subunit D
LLPTIRYSALKSGKNFHIRKDCIKENMRLVEQGASILFVVDSSGSMGIEQQMIKVKTLIYSLLIDAYQKRDRVGMITFRATDAKLVLPFTNSVHIAKKKLEKLETGGKTPLAHGLKLAYKVLKQEKSKNPFSYNIMILVSDGRGNVPLEGKNCLDQAEYYGLYIKKLGIKALVLDTEIDHLAFGYSWELAKLMNGKYMKLDDLNAENVEKVVFSL